MSHLTNFQPASCSASGPILGDPEAAAVHGRCAPVPPGTPGTPATPISTAVAPARPPATSTTERSAAELLRVMAAWPAPTARRSSAPVRVAPDVDGQALRPPCRATTGTAPGPSGRRTRPRWRGRRDRCRCSHRGRRARPEPPPGTTADMSSAMPVRVRLPWESRFTNFRETSFSSSRSLGGFSGSSPTSRKVTLL